MNVGTQTPRASVDSVQLKVASILHAGARYAYGGPGHLRPGRNGDPLITHCSGCGANADEVSVDARTELCDTCTDEGVTWLD